MKKSQKNKELVQAQLMDQTVEVNTYCSTVYVHDNSGTSCSSAYTCNPNGVYSPSEDDDVLL